MEIYTGRIWIDTMKGSADISFDPFNPACPHCNATMVGVTCDQKFADKLKGNIQ